MNSKLGFGIALAATLIGGAAQADVSSKSVAVSFEGCNLAIRTMASKIAQAPDNIMETNEMRMVRFYTNDGSVLVTCSRPDGKMVVTTNTGGGQSNSVTPNQVRSDVVQPASIP